MGLGGCSLFPSEERKFAPAMYYLSSGDKEISILAALSVAALLQNGRDVLPPA
jgi:hypothetical protein